MTSRIFLDLVYEPNKQCIYFLSAFKFVMTIFPKDLKALQIIQTIFIQKRLHSINKIQNNNRTVKSSEKKERRSRLSAL